MRHAFTVSLFGLLSIVAAAPAWAAGEGGEPADPRLAPRAQTAPEVASVEQRLDLTAPFAGSDVWLAAGPCEAPCAPPPPPPPPCGVCRKGYDSCGNPKWGFDLAIGGWLSGLSGTIGARGRDTDVSMTPADALDYLSSLDFTISGGVRATYGRWNFRVGLYYMGIGNETHVSDENSVDVKFEQWLVDGAVGYRVAEVPLGCEPCAPCMAVQPFVGVRYNSLDLTIDDSAVATNFQSVHKNQSWTDLIVGAELLFDFRNHWWSRLEGDVGGFGFSGSTDMTWSLRGEVGYQFNDHVGTYLGFGAVGWDYEDGGFKWNLTQWGPYLGFVFSF